MSTTKTEHSEALMDYVIYGDDTIVRALSKSSPDIGLDIKRCTDAKNSIGQLTNQWSGQNVCNDCEEEYTSLIDEVDSNYSDLDSHLDSIVQSHQALEAENVLLKGIIQDIIGYAVDAVPADDLTEFEEQLIIKRLKGEQ
jgi:hypothetical protein